MSTGGEVYVQPKYQIDPYNTEAMTLHEVKVDSLEVKEQDWDIILVSYDSIWKSPHLTDYTFGFTLVVSWFYRIKNQILVPLIVFCLSE